MFALDSTLMVHSELAREPSGHAAGD